MRKDKYVKDEVHYQRRTNRKEEEKADRRNVIEKRREGEGWRARFIDMRRQLR